MSIEKSPAVILRVVEFSNTSCIVTALTRDFGKISALAKGAWRKKSPFESALDVLAICHLVFIHKAADVLDLLTEAKLERRFRTAAKDLQRLYAAYYFVELVMSLTDAADPQPELYDLLVSALMGLEDGEPVDAWVLRFEIRILSIVGQAPSLEHCTHCGEPIEPHNRKWFGLSAGGIVCAKCRPGKRMIVALPPEIFEKLNCFSRQDDRWKEVQRLDESLGRIRGLMNQYMAYVLSRKPKLLKYLYP